MVGSKNIIPSRFLCGPGKKISETSLTFFLFTLFQLLNPTEFFADIVVEHEYNECTSSTIQALVLFKHLYPNHRTEEINSSIKKAVQYIENIQMLDGSWYGSWGVCFTYSAWFGLGGLAAAGKTYNNCLAVRKGVHFLLTTQKDNGGWGESYLSCSKKV